MFVECYWSSAECGTSSNRESGPKSRDLPEHLSSMPRTSPSPV
jgi:hypothetical protein